MYETQSYINESSKHKLIHVEGRRVAQVEDERQTKTIWIRIVVLLLCIKKIKLPHSASFLLMINWGESKRATFMLVQRPVLSASMREWQTDLYTANIALSIYTNLSAYYKLLGFRNVLCSCPHGLQCLRLWRRVIPPYSSHSVVGISCRDARAEGGKATTG